MCDSTSGNSAVDSLLCLTANINPDLSSMSTTTTSSKEGMIEANAGASGKGSSNNDVPASASSKQNQVGTVMLFGVPIVSLVMDGKERLCLAQISSTLLKEFSYNEIHNRRVALGINCVQCTPVQLEILRRAGAMPVTSRRCGMITRREAERLCKSFLGDHAPPQLPENFAFDVYHECGWGCRGSFVPSRYNSSRAKCIRCSFCQLFFSPNKFIFHSHRLPESRYVQPDAANFNSWRRHMKLCGDPPEEANSSDSSSDLVQINMAWEDVKAMFNGGTRKRLLAATISPSSTNHSSGRHSTSNSNSTGGGGGSGSGKVSHKSSHSHSSNTGESHSTSGSGERNHSRNAGNSHHGSTKKESPSASGLISSSTSAIPVSVATTVPPSVAGYNNHHHDESHASTFLHHHSQNPFLQVPNPLLSPTGRLDAIWNPALPGPMAAAAAAAVAGQGVRPCSIPGSPSFPSLPFHPLSIPWLRRPLFPFSHPFGPTLLNESSPAAAQEKLASLTAASRQNQSAFKPVSRNVEPLFNWLNGNTFGSGGPLAFGHPSTSLPEDLSVNSSSHGTPGATPSNIGSNSSGNAHFNNINLNSSIHSTENTRTGGGRGTPFSIAKQLESSGNNTNEKSSNHRDRNNLNANNNGKQTHHQIQILTTQQNESDDEENVDIESTVETEECSSTSSVWVSSTTALLGKNGGTISPTHTLGHTNNNNLSSINNNNTIMGFNRRKRLAANNNPSCYSSGDDEMIDDRDSDNQDYHTPASPSDNYEIYRLSGGQDRDKCGKRRRLWVNEIISTTDDDEEGSRQMLVNKGKGENKHINATSSTRTILESRE